MQGKALVRRNLPTKTSAPARKPMVNETVGWVYGEFCRNFLTAAGKGQAVAGNRGARSLLQGCSRVQRAVARPLNRRIEPGAFRAGGRIKG
jgi:hypothetical protein